MGPLEATGLCSFSQACTDARLELVNTLNIRGRQAATPAEKTAEAASVTKMASKLFDCARAMFICKTMEDMEAVLQGLLTECSVAKRDRLYDVVRVKQRFEKPTPPGWADIFINLRSRETGYTVELQVGLCSIFFFEYLLIFFNIF